jgi:DNA-directed RNA polymerase III subunit RPC8
MRPVEGEVLLGTIRQCTPEGVLVSLGFFDDILLPGSCLQPGSLFDAAEQVWVWNYGESQLFMDVGEPIRFRLLEQHFIEEAPVRKEVLMAAKMAAMNPAVPVATQATAEPEEEPVPEQSPFRLVGSIAEDGLGLVSWWGQ